jgi:hypothetical protein
MAQTCSRQPRQCKRGRWMGSGKRDSDRRLRLQQQSQLQPRRIANGWQRQQHRQPQRLGGQHSLEQQPVMMHAGVILQHRRNSSDRTAGSS